LFEQYSDSTKKPRINYVLYPIIFSSDSIIQPFKYDIKIGYKHIVNSSTATIFQYLDKQLPTKSFVSLSDDSVQIGGKQNKPTLLNFWFTACSPCIAEMPILNKLRAKYADKMNFISVTFSEKDDVFDFLKRHEFNFEHIVEADDYIQELEIDAYPKNIFINKDGILMSIEGGVPFESDGSISSGQEFESIIKEIL
jgi:thiol-disulfide isomerase/thioredoxin